MRWNFLSRLNNSYYSYDTSNKEAIVMGNPKKNSKDFVPNHIGTQSKKAGGNKGKQMQDTTGKQPIVDNG